MICYPSQLHAVHDFIKIFCEWTFDVFYWWYIYCWYLWCVLLMIYILLISLPLPSWTDISFSRDFRFSFNSFSFFSISFNSFRMFLSCWVLLVNLLFALFNDFLRFSLNSTISSALSLQSCFTRSSSSVSSIPLDISSLRQLSNSSTSSLKSPWSFRTSWSSSNAVFNAMSTQCYPTPMDTWRGDCEMFSRTVPFDAINGSCIQFS